MQSQKRKLKRQMMGIQSNTPNSTKIAKSTKAGKITGLHCYRANRFNTKPLTFKEKIKVWFTPKNVRKWQVLTTRGLL